MRLFAAIAAAAVAAVLGAVAWAQENPPSAAAVAEAERIIAANPAYAGWLREPANVVTALEGPLLPGSPWRVHDIRRPQPPVVTPSGRCAAPPPSDATVLFNGRGMDAWDPATVGKFSVRNGALVAGGDGVTGGMIATKERFGDVQVHLEWRSPADSVTTAEPQARGNSGVYLMGRYEVQVLNSYRYETYADGTAGALYGQVPPLVNALRPTGQWNCYDIVFKAPRFGADGAVLSPARVTLFVNGVLAQADTPMLGATRFREVATYEAHPPEGPLGLQDHGDLTSKVQYRNIWVRRLAGAGEAPQP